jgi:hypothetical protein
MEIGNARNRSRPAIKAARSEEDLRMLQIDPSDKFEDLKSDYLTCFHPDGHWLAEDIVIGVPGAFDQPSEGKGVNVTMCGTDALT